MLLSYDAPQSRAPRITCRLHLGIPVLLAIGVAMAGCTTSPAKHTGTPTPAVATHAEPKTSEVPKEYRRVRTAIASSGQHNERSGSLDYAPIPLGDPPESTQTPVASSWLIPAQQIQNQEEATTTPLIEVVKTHPQEVEEPVPAARRASISSSKGIQGCSSGLVLIKGTYVCNP